MKTFKNHSKAEALLYLEKYKKKLKTQIPKFIFFTKKNYLKDPDKYINKISKLYKKKKIIIRSSALNEDRINESNAGKYKSFGNIDASNKSKINFCIKRIISDFKNPQDQILVQQFIANPDCSGVIFTRTFNSNSPYYVINYDESGKTNLVTSGKDNPSMKTLVIFKNKINNQIFFGNNLKILPLIEKKFNNDRLDIEFCIKKNLFYLLQCRPLKKVKKIDDKFVEPTLVNIEKKIKKLNQPIHNLEGKSNCFSNMSDWNPAEMIGVRPSMLALSLYSELITDEVWSRQRSDYGYKDVRPNPLMISFGGAPYIDLRVDFNSFLPSKLPLKIQKKAIEFYLKKIKKKPELHDKIEFDVVETCYDFNTNSRLSEFLNKKEIKIYSKYLKEILNKILDSKNSILKKEMQKVSTLEEKIKIIKEDNISDIQKIYFYIKYCKMYGTLPFAGIARCAFISTKLIRSLLKQKMINQENYKNFYESIKTVTKNICKEYRFIKKDKNKRKIFLKKYGHLRPSTYYISSKNYKENYNSYFSSKSSQNFNKIKRFNLEKDQIQNINKIFKSHGIKTNFSDFFNFASEAIELREYSKMIFAKAINEIFISLIKLAKEIKIKREDLENISIKNIMNLYTNVDIQKLKKSLTDEIKKNNKDQKMRNLIEFPEFISHSKDIYVQEQSNNLANFVTKRNINGEILEFSKIKNFKSLKNKIVLLKNADPGYDFIFSHNIKGLITQYGGANSHMSIRCLELDIPAIIGIGRKNYSQISENNFIQINCNQKYYKIIR